MTSSILIQNLERLHIALETLHGKGALSPLDYVRLDNIAVPERSITTVQRHDDGTYSLSIELDQNTLDVLSSGHFKLQSGHFNAIATTLEEFSHFNHLTSAILQDRAIRVVELELHGELDKFFALSHLAHEDCGDAHYETFLHLLFDRAAIVSKNAECYQVAERMAHQFIKTMLQGRSKRKWLEGHELKEIRDFFRLNWQDKVSYLNASSGQRVA